MRKQKKSLIQVSIAIAPEAGEAVATVLEPILGQPPSIYTHEDTRATTATVYFEENNWDSSLLTKISEALQEIRSCGIDVGPGKIATKKIRHQDWAESWKHHFKPIEIGRALLVKPGWSKRRPKKSQALVLLDPGLSFGTGQHATTLFCLEQLVACRRNHEKQSFLDIGTGSGILAIAAAKLGYSPVQAFDFDPESVRVSRENVRQNNVEKQVRPVRRDLTKLPSKSKAHFDVICANLIYDLLIAESDRICNRLKPGGDLILAGILVQQFEKVKLCYEKLGFTLAATKIGNEWQSGRFTAPT